MWTNQVIDLIERLKVRHAGHEEIVDPLLECLGSSILISHITNIQKPNYNHAQTHTHMQKH